MQRQKTALAAALLAAFTATSAAACEPNCNTPTLKGSGPYPIHHVVRCLKGTNDTGYVTVACDDKDAWHPNDNGVLVVCFQGEDGRIGEDIPAAVEVGAQYYNFDPPDGVPDNWVAKWTGTRR